jgi:hypothetical protein
MGTVEPSRWRSFSLPDLGKDSATSNLQVMRSINTHTNNQKFWALEQRLESEVGLQLDQSYLIAKSRLPIDSPYVGSFHRWSFSRHEYLLVSLCVHVCEDLSDRGAGQSMCWFFLVC